ncbi:MAG: Calx-beta domain-containing protein [Pyrinomonadaceae bacterium]
MIYATRPSTVGSEGNSITRINPLTGEIGASVYVGSEPNKLALSDNGQTMYVSLDGAYAIRRYETSTQMPGVQFPVGRESTSSNPLGAPYRAGDIAVAPGNPNLLAVARDKPGIKPPGAGVAMFNNGVQLPLTGPGHSDSANYLAFSSSATTLYGGAYYGEGLRTLTVSESGVVDNTGNPTSFEVRKLKFENNLVFTSTGHIINPETRTLMGTCPGVNTPAFVPDTATGRVLYAVKDSSSSNITIKAFDINTFTLIGSMVIPNTTGDAEPTTLVRYGTNGLAMRTMDNNKLFFIQTSLLPTGNPLPPPSATPMITPTPTPTVFATYIRQLTLPNRDLIYSRTEQKFYASVPSAAGTPRANSVTRINPTTAALENSVVVGSQPGRLALSDDDQTMYVGIDGAYAVRKFDVATQTPGLQFSLGNGVNGPKTACDIDVMPGNSNAVAVSYGNIGYNYDGVDIYDEGVKRAQKANMSGSIEFASPSLLYIGENYLYRYGVSPNGLSEQDNFTTNSYLEAEMNSGLLYTSNGGVIDLANTAFKGSFTGLGYPSIVTVDAPNNRVFFLTSGDGMGGSVWTLRAYRLDNFLPAGRILLQGINVYGSPRRLFRWGENGLAFNDNNDKIYFIQTDLVSTNGTVPTVIQLGAQTFTTNENANLQVTVTRTGGLTGTSMINYTTQDGTATAGTDYIATSGTLIFAAGESTKTIEIPVINDNVYEGNETLSIMLSNPVGGEIELQEPSTAALTIVDNESLPVISSANVIVNEPRIAGTSTALFTVQLSNATTQTVSVIYTSLNGTATAGNDYVPVFGELTFAPLETTKTFEVQVLADQNYNEPNENFWVRFSGAQNAAIGTFQAMATIINYNPQTVPHVRFDFDGDGKSDISIFRPSVGEWWYLRSSDGGNYAAQFGTSSDKLTPGDFTGDGKADIAIWRPSTGEWYILRSEDGSYYSYPFGISGDIPAVGDFDGDGKADSAVFRPSDTNWYIRRSSDGGFTIRQFGTSGDAPAVADYDGDKKSDVAIWRASTGEWWIQKSSNSSVVAFQFGNSSDKPVQGDYTGDGKADVAIYRPSSGEWFILRSEDFSYYSFPFGTSGDVPAPGDYDGDGKFDATVFRPSDSTWYVQQSAAGTLIQSFGITGDVPVPNAFVP